MKNIDKLSRGVTRRYWRQFVKKTNMNENRALAAKAHVFRMAWVMLEDGEDWRTFYAMFRWSQLTKQGRSLLPKLP